MSPAFIFLHNGQITDKIEYWGKTKNNRPVEMALQSGL